MKVLFDTHAFLWAITADSRLSDTASNLFKGSGTDIFFSVASVWEVLIKAEGGRLQFPKPAGAFLISEIKANSATVLPVLLPHVLRVEQLPAHHRDPFDRILIAQAIEENLPIVTVDAKFLQYPVEVIW